MKNLVFFRAEMGGNRRWFGVSEIEMGGNIIFEWANRFIKGDLDSGLGNGQTVRFSNFEWD
jgi:hypothetical protein